LSKKKGRSCRKGIRGKLDEPSELYIYSLRGKNPKETGENGEGGTKKHRTFVISRGKREGKGRRRETISPEIAR